MRVSHPEPWAVAGHAVRLYADEAELVDAVDAFARAGIDAGEAVLVVATPAHRRAFEAALPHGATVIDAEETLRRFFVGGRLDRAAFDRVVGGLIRRAPGPIRVFGEMVAVLWDAGHVTAALELEELWSELARARPFSLLCAYPAASVDGALGELCHLHTAATGSRSFPRALDAPRAARRFADGLLGTTARPGVVADAKLVVSELAANAVVHARSGFRVELSVADGEVRIAVADRSPAPPVPLAAAADDMSGRGLEIVATTARAWGWEPRGGGKVVWAELGP
jgi:anti-sigma regulatory factor (Ser/Thr protein kinase)